MLPILELNKIVNICVVVTVNLHCQLDWSLNHLGDTLVEKSVEMFPEGVPMLFPTFSSLCLPCWDLSILPFLSPEAFVLVPENVTPLHS